jgi:phytol kinase
VPGLLAVLAGAFLAHLLGAFAGAQRDAGVRVGYTRKVVHFGVFTAAALVYLGGALPLTNAFGVGVALRVGVCVARGRDDPLFRAFARPADAPRERLFIVVPLLTTAVGGLATALLTGPFAAVGYLVGGWGDAAGEPVGSRWGRHRYRVPSLAGVPAERSLEGSAAVFFAGTVAAGVALLLQETDAASPALGAAALGAGLAGAVVEAVSPHGTDNLTVPLAAATTARLLLG